MLGWLFGKRAAQAQGEDCAWLSDAARLGGVAREVERLAGTGRAVVLVAWVPAVVESCLKALAPLQPVRCRHAHERGALRQQVARPGSVTVALAGALSEDATPSSVPVEVLVWGRNESRLDDERALRFARQLGADTRVTFHLSLDDPLLQGHAESIRPVLATLGGSEDEPISHVMLTRAIARAQSR
jgi:hypothetical protein